MLSFSSFRPYMSHPSPPSLASPPTESGLTATFLRIGGRLRHIATQLLGSEAEAEDALYEAFARLWQRNGNADNESTAKQEALLTTTVRNLSIDTLRRRTSHPCQLLDDNDVSHLEAAITRQSTQEEESDTDERFAEVSRLIDQHLTPLQRQLLYRRDVDGIDYATLALETDMQETAVRMQLSRVRRTIRLLYQQQNSPHS